MKVVDKIAKVEIDSADKPLEDVRIIKASVIWNHKSDMFKYYKYILYMVKMNNKWKFSYNELDDSLIISCNAQNETSKEKFMFDDIIFHIT